MSKRITEFSFPHPPIDFEKVWLHLHRMGSPLYMDTYFKTWAFKDSQEYYTDYYPLRGDFEDLYLFFKENNWYGKYNIKYFGYVMLDYFVEKEHFQNYLVKKQELKEEISKLWRSQSRESVKESETEDQIQLLDTCLTLMIKSFVIDPFAPMIGEMAPDYASWWLEQKGVTGEEKKKAFHLLFASDQVSETIQRQLEVKGAIEAVSEDERDEVLSKLAKEFAFAKTEFSGYIPYTEKDVLGEYESVKQIDITVEEEQKEKSKLLEELEATEQEKFIFYLFGYCQYSRDERKEYLQKLMALADWCLEEFSNKYDIPVGWLRSALVGEITSISLEDSEFKNTLEKRYKEGIAMYWKDCGTGEYVEGKEGENVYEEVDKKDSEQVEIKGMSTFYGKVQGIVKIVSDPADEIPTEPFVLVTGMTSPDFIHFMQKCVAIVTDEGGITSHAAILSRELKKPCIVGTGNARKLLQDGDMVEVDADEGIVTILK